MNLASKTVHPHCTHWSVHACIDYKRHSYDQQRQTIDKADGEFMLGWVTVKLAADSMACRCIGFFFFPLLNCNQISLSLSLCNVSVSKNILLHKIGREEISGCEKGGRSHSPHPLHLGNFRRNEEVWGKLLLENQC